MKFLLWAITAVNIYFGLYCFLNVIHVLRSSKYSQTATLIFAILFLSMGIGSLYLLLMKHNLKYALWLGIGPWLLALLFLFITMMTSDYK